MENITEQFFHALAVLTLCGMAPGGLSAPEKTVPRLYAPFDGSMQAACTGGAIRPADSAIHRYDALFHLDADSAKIADETLAVQAESADSAILRIIPARTPGLECRVIRGREEPVQGWANGPWRPIPTAVYSVRGKGVVWMAYVLAPVPAGAARPPGLGVDIVPSAVPADSATARLTLRIRRADGSSDIVAVVDGGAAHPAGRPFEIQWQRVDARGKAGVVFECKGDAAP